MVLFLLMLTASFEPIFRGLTLLFIIFSRFFLRILILYYLRKPIFFHSIYIDFITYLFLMKLLISCKPHYILIPWLAILSLEHDNLLQCIVELTFIILLFKYFHSLFCISRFINLISPYFLFIVLWFISCYTVQIYSNFYEIYFLLISGQYLKCKNNCVLHFIVV